MSRIASGLRVGLLLLFPLCLPPATACAVELYRITPAVWDEVVPEGKEVDCIYGDLVLRNDQLVAVIAQPLPNRKANMTTRGAGGSIIDLTVRSAPNDQLTCYFPGAASQELTDVATDTNGAAKTTEPRVLYQCASQLEYECHSVVTAGKPLVTHRYRLADGDKGVTIISTYSNPHGEAITFPLQDAIRADRSFDFRFEADQSRFTACDQWWHQAYAVVAQDHAPAAVGDTLERKRPIINWTRAGRDSADTTLAPGESYTLTRVIYPANSELDLLGRLNHLTVAAHAVKIKVVDPAGPISNALVEWFQGDERIAQSRTRPDGTVQTAFPAGQYRIAVTGLGRTTVSLDVAIAAEQSAVQTVNVELEQPGYVEARITDDQGRRIPCKVEFRGTDGTASPDFGPDTYVDAIGNLVYTPNGMFRQEIGPGEYEVIISHGPEFDAVFTSLTVQRGADSQLTAQLRRSVTTPGWISSDFHSHSTPSGDNTSSQAGRVLNLLAEHIEFAPCTEHNRISTYEPHLAHYQATALMATCSGMELTGQPLPVNHQNSFPLHHHPRTQDGGGPESDENPIVQIERLALWDQRSQKVVQGNHPNLMQILGDRDTDGNADEGFERMLSAMDVVEVHPPQAIFDLPTQPPAPRDRPNTMFNWLQLLNQGYRIPGVVNTDAHYNFHGSGWLRNYLSSPTDDPAQVRTADMVHAAEAGHVIMSNGPYLELSAEAVVDQEIRRAIAGDDLVADDGAVTLKIRIQCPNWCDINRVQLFINGKPSTDHDY
ncbi:MAG: carboxypeptidase regulatory-like domain-containing protein, partial [Planctomycetales bacterium]|nr:carboxypeptidase regulatory-like domain-containing protein [Planctomycetales bacterium]